MTRWSVGFAAIVLGMFYLLAADHLALGVCKFGCKQVEYLMINPKNAAELKIPVCYRQSSKNCYWPIPGLKAGIVKMWAKTLDGGACEIDAKAATLFSCDECQAECTDGFPVETGGCTNANPIKEIQIWKCKGGGGS